VDTADAGLAFDQLSDNVILPVFQQAGQDMVGDMREILSVPVQRVGNFVLRSISPDPPRTETGLLMGTIDFVTDDNPVALCVYSPLDYSPILESDSFITGPRKHWSVLYEWWQVLLPDAVQAAVDNV
jgi:hypothetical protein